MSLYDIFLGEHDLYGQSFWGFVLFTSSDYKASLDKFLFHEEFLGVPILELLEIKTNDLQQSLYEVQDLPLVLISFNLCFNTTINIIPVFKYWLIYKQLYNEDWAVDVDSLRGYIHHFLFNLFQVHFYLT
jgi:hypothetical protein